MSSLEAFESMPAGTRFLPDGKEHSNVHAERLDRLGHQLTRPASWWLNGFSRIFLLRFKPGWWGQQSSPAAEVLYRASLVIVGLIGLPFAVLSTCFGGSMRALSSLAKRDFIYHPSPKGFNKNGNGKQDCKLMSYNVQLMPEFLVNLNRQRPTMERVHEVSQAILQSDADIICLQEVFHTEAAEVLDRDLQAQGYNVVRNVGHQVLGLNSGLFLASKYELENIQYIKHPPLQSGVDALANKGLLLATANIRGKKVVIANAHFSNAGSNDLPNYVIRAGQALAITARIDKYVKDMLAKGMRINGVIFNTDANIGPTPFDEDDCKRPLKPSVDPEWHLTNRLYQDVASLNIPQAKDFENPKAWAGFKKKVMETYDQLAAEVPKIAPLEFVKSGGPLPSSLYSHDLQTATNYEKAIEGSFIDLSSHPGLVWGKKTATYPARLDFIMTRKPFTHNGTPLAEPKLHNFEITPMLSKEGRLTSDHYAVTAKFHLESVCTDKGNSPLV